MNKVEIEAALIESNILTDLVENDIPAQKIGLEFKFTGNCIIEELDIKIQVFFDHHFPLHKPKYFLLNKEDIDFIPHIDNDSSICYTHDENLVLDINNPVGIISETFALTVETIGAGIRKENTIDFINEWEAYWRDLPNSISIFANIIPSENVETIKIGKAKDETFFAVTDNEECVNSIGTFMNTQDSTTLYNALYIPLLPNNSLIPPNYKTGLTIELIKELIFNNVTEKNKKKIFDLVKAKPRNEHYIILSLPQPNGNFAFFGIKLCSINNAEHPFLDNKNKVTIKPLTLTRLDKAYMLTRGGNGINFQDKKVLVIGAGSVGSYICDELIKSSIIKLDLVDNDQLGIENCYRHLCGRRGVGTKKVIAIKTFLENTYPYCQIESYPNLIENLIQKNKIDFKNYGAVVIATGNATINTYLMKLIIHAKIKIPVIFSWLDPYGIGGHCLVTNISDKGCYQCLYNNSTSNKASFASDQQPRTFLKSISGCGSVYSPYSSMDARETAILTVRKIMDIFKGEEKENAIYSWKGDSKQFQEEGYLLSNRYLQNDAELKEKKTLFYDPNCSYCGKN